MLPFLGPPHLFTVQAIQSLSRPCADDAGIQPDSPGISLHKISVTENSIVLWFFIGGFDPNVHLNNKNFRSGRLVLSLDNSPWFEYGQFPRSPYTVIVLTNIKSGKHRLFYALKNVRGIVSYGQKCFKV